MILLLAVVIVILALVGAVFFYRMQGQANKAVAEQQSVRAEHAEASVSIRQQLDTALDASQQAHREETINETKPEHLSVRCDFDNTWSSGSLSNPAQPAAIDTNSTAATGAPGVTGYHRDRTDLSEG